MSSPLPALARFWQLVAIAVLVLCSLCLIGTVLYPPWDKVSGDQFWGITLSTQKTDFAGFDSLNSTEKWKRTSNGPQWSGYRISWSLLIPEWISLAAVMAIAVAVLRCRGQKVMTEQRPNQ